MHEPKKFSDLSAWKQILQLIAMGLAAGLPVMAVLAWAADQRINEKYATDQDLAAVQEQVTRSVEELKSESAANTSALKQTARSVDSLTLTVIDLQIRELSDDIERLMRERRADGNDWTTAQAARLREKERALADLEAQRKVLFQRLISRARNGDPR